MTALLGQSWLTARGLTGWLLLAGSALVTVGILMFTWRVFLHAPAGARPGYYQWERGLVFGGFLGLALGLAALKSLLVQAGDPLWAEVGLTAYALAAVLLTISEVAGLTAAGLPAGLVGALIRVFVVLSFLGQAAFGAAILQTGLLPAWLGWTTVIWNVGWLALMLRAGDPYYPFMHLELPLLAGIWLLVNR
ncbi:MAG: hypothetical protein ABI847_02370 [Anaerolineales bacterium]